MKVGKLVLGPLALLLALCAAPRLDAFMFWLDAPTRSNPFDQKNPNYVVRTTPYAYPTAYPTNTPLPSATFTATPSASPNYSATPTLSYSSTPTVSPVYSPTSTETFSSTPSASPSSSVTPIYSPTASPSASPNYSPTPTTVATHGSLVDDVEAVGAQDRTYWNGGPVLTVKDGLGSTQNPNPWGPNSGTAGGAYGSSGYAACMSGNMLVQIGAPTNQYPYCFIAFELTPGGSAPPSSGGGDVDVTPYSPNHGLVFDYKAGAPGVIYHVKLISTLVTDFGYYEWDFTSVDTAWHTATVYFPGTPGAPQVFAQPGWAAVKTFDPTKIGAIMFEPIPQTSGPVAYNLCVDNISFAVAPAPAPNPTPTFGPGTMVMNFENNAANDTTLAPFTQGVSTNSDASSTIFPKPWTPSSGSAPGSNASGPASSYAGCFSGSLIAQDPPNNIYPYGVMELLLAASGWGNGGGAVNIGPYAPSKRMIFDYKAGTAGIQYGIQIITSNVTDYGFYECLFTPSNTTWNTQAVYFPDANVAFTPKFAQPGWAAPQPWNAALAGEILVRVVPVTGSPVNFDLCIDNLRFD